MRCPDCNKFASMEFAEPEVETLEIDDDGHISCTVRLTRTCAECGTELKEGTLEFTNEDHVKTVEDHIEECHPERPKDEADVEEGKVYADEVCLEISEDGVDPIEEGTRKKMSFGAEVSFTITCDGCKKDLVEGRIGDKMLASDMEEIV